MKNKIYNKNNIIENKNNKNNIIKRNINTYELGGGSDLIKSIMNDVYLRKDLVDSGIFNQINYFSVIMSLQLSEISFDETIKPDVFRNLICSIVYYMGDRDKDVSNILNRLSYKSYSNDLHIVYVSWLKSISLNELDEISVNNHSFKNVFGEEYTLYTYHLSYHKFFNNLKMLFDFRSDIEQKDKYYLGLNPIIVFSGVSMGNIVNLFKSYNYKLNGGTISRRHKLNLVEYRLSIFVDLLDLYNNNKDLFVSHYKENLFSSSKNKLKEEENHYYTQFKLIDSYLGLLIEANELYKSISINIDLLNETNQKIESLKSEINYNYSNISINLNEKSRLNSKLVPNISPKHKASLTGRIKNFNLEISNLNTENLKKELEIKKLTLNISKLSNNINNLKFKSDEIQKVLQEKKIKIQSIVDPAYGDSENVINNNSTTKKKNSNIYNNYKKKNNSISNNLNNVRREYHSLTNQRAYSTSPSVKKFNFNINSPIFLELQRILNNSSLNSETQMKIEQFLKNQGYFLLKNRLEKNSDINYYKINKYILDYFKKSLGELDKLVDNYRLNLSKITNLSKLEKVEGIIVKGLSNEIIISHLLGRILRIISNNNLINKNTNATDLAVDLGNSLVFEYYSQEYRKKYNDLESPGLNVFIHSEYKDLYESATDDVLFNFGIKMLNLLVEVGLIHSVINTIDIDHKSHIYIANSQIQKDLGKSLELLNISYKIPMIVTPKAYGCDKKGEILGGYLLNDKDFIIPIIIKNPNLKEQSEIKEDNVIYDLVNNLSSVGYKINTQVLDFLFEKGLDYGLMLDSNVKHELEIKKDKGKKLTLLETKTLESYLSRKQLEMNIFGLAIIFKNVPEFYIPVRLDNRGRVYCNVDYLHYQGIELAKSLLLFSKGEKIYKNDTKSIEFLKIFGDNCFGNGIDKKSFKDRVEWVNENENEILNFYNGNLISKADSKLLFIAFCFEYLNYHNSLFNMDTFYISHFPIQLDATCNGYQHLSLLIGDEDLAGELNLIEGEDNRVPKDFYKFVALKINDYFLKRISEENKILDQYKNLNDNDPNFSSDSLNKSKKIIESCNKLLKLNINRSLVKSPIMVKPYNASFPRMVDYLKENLDKILVDSDNYNGIIDNINKDLILPGKKNSYKVLYKSPINEEVILNNFDLNLFISTLEKVFINEFPKLKLLSNYLLNIASICSFLNISITWALPSGLEVKQYYVDSEAIRLKPFKFKKSTYNLKIKTNKLDKKKQSRALMPNLIHSLDASSLSLILDLFYQNSNHIENFNHKINFFAIHDCFAVTANNIDNLFKFIKLVYIKIYSDDNYLKKFDKGIIESIKNQFGNDSFNHMDNTIKVNNTTLDYPNVNEVIVGKIKASSIYNSNFIIN